MAVWEPEEDSERGQSLKALRFVDGVCKPILQGSSGFRCRALELEGGGTLSYFYTSGCPHLAIVFEAVGRQDMDLKGRDLASKVGVFWSTCCRLQELWPRIFGEDLTLALQPVPPSSEAL